jgi:hypothetical protein
VRIVVIVLLALEVLMPSVYNVKRADGWDRSNTSELVSALKDMPVNHTATVTVKDRANSDLSSVISVFRVADGWVVHSPAEVEPTWVTILRNGLSSDKDPITEIDF